VSRAARRLDVRDLHSGFESGEVELDAYLRNFAWMNDQAGVAHAYVLEPDVTDPSSWPKVLGYYTLSMATTASEHVAEVLKRKLPRYPMPTVLIGRFAVDQRVGGRGIGKLLLLDALRRGVQAADGPAGCVGIVVDAKHEKALGFYEHFAFSALAAGERPWPRRCFLSIPLARERVAAPP
jgi:GNAT superfamily N-acetyltransferase